jgi:hypothetical protein
MCRSGGARVEERGHLGTCDVMAGLGLDDGARFVQ